MKRHSSYGQTLPSNAKPSPRPTLWLIAALISGGCATATTVRPPAVPAVPEPAAEVTDLVAPEPVAPEPVAKEAKVVPPVDPIYDMLQKVKQPSGQTRAQLDAIARTLRQRFAPNPPPKTAKKWVALARFTLERYYEILPLAPISPDAPLAVLIDAMPESVAADLARHPHYRELKMRVLAGRADVPIDLTPEVVDYIRYFQTEKREFFARCLSRSTAYLPMIQAVFRKHGLPEDLAYKALVESGFNSRAQSRVRALGLWQFMYRTGLLYGLRRNTYRDDRMDPEKATRAAARHLAHLYRYFGDWRLVVAAYNCGQGRMDGAIAKSKTRDFWKIHALPRETRNHVPKFMAAVIMAQDPEFFGFENIVYQPALSYDNVAVTEPISLRLAAECAGTTYAWLRQLNPDLRRAYTPPATRRTPYALRVPKGAAAKFRANYARVPAHRKIQMVDYVVKRGDTLSGIASRMGVSQSALTDANGIANPRRLQIGHKLVVPLYPGAKYSVRTASRKRNIDPTPDPERYRRVDITVRAGDSLWEIAKREGITVSHLSAWNDLNTNRPIHPGDRLTLWLPKDGASDSPVFYTVRAGDTLWEIARAFDTSVEALQSLNGIQSPSRLRPGVRLRVREIAE